MRSEHTNTEGRSNRMASAYMEGFEVGRTARIISPQTEARIKEDPAFWQGFHDGRPGYNGHDFIQLMDPTRAGGWYVNPRKFPDLARACEPGPRPASG